MNDFRKSLVASLHGGPADQVKLPLKGTEQWVHPWPGYLCLNMAQGMPMHYTLVSNGVYEFGGACAEFDHDPKEHVPRCPDCGAKIVPGSQVTHKGPHRQE